MIPLALVALCVSPALIAQEPVLHAAEVAAYEAARRWQAQLDGGEPVNQLWAAGFETLFFGYGTDDQPKSSERFDLDRQWASVVVLWPRRDALIRYRPLMANSLGRIFIGQPPEGVENWRPSIATIAARGVPEDLANMLLQSGQAADGTRWQRAESLEGDVSRPQSVRLIGDGASHQRVEFTIASPRFRWHPGWLPLAEGTAVAQHGEIVGGEKGKGRFEGRGIPARGLHLNLTSTSGSEVRGRIVVKTFQATAVLEPEAVRSVGGELLIALPADAMVESARLDDQAWAAEALRQLAEFELAARRDATIDRDQDGKGEFGEPDEVVPVRLRRYQRLSNGRYLFRNHLFALHLPADADGREQRFVAFAWPAEAKGRHDLAFAVDERGEVLRCSAHERFAGHARAPAAAAIADRELGWRPLR